jgi:hypothetical protein
MARVRSVDFLPEIFKTDVNKEFLGATLDQLVQQPKLKRTQGYIGRRFGPGTNPTDAYILEPSNLRTNYQLEPGVVILDEDGSIENAITYPEIVDALAVNGANVLKHDRLFASEQYSWDPKVDLDKFINYGQYYWVPEGPDAVDVSATDVAMSADFDITSTSDDYYNVSSIAGDNPVITLVRGGTYYFNVDQNSNFWIQAEAGVDGVFDFASNISSRDVFGVSNNGATNGTVKFNVPQYGAQNYYHNLTELTHDVDLVTTERFDSINLRYVDGFAGIDGTTDLEGKSIVFVGTYAADSEDSGWQRLATVTDTVNFRDGAYSTTTDIDDIADRYSVYRVDYVRPNGPGDDTDMYIELVRQYSINNETRFTVLSGNQYSRKSFFKNQAGYLAEVPLLTADADVLYYQDGTTAGKFGVIKLIDIAGAQTIDINESIIGQANYTSPTGVTFTNGLKVTFRGNVEPAEYADNTYYVEGVGSSIQLILASSLTTDESYITLHNDIANAPAELDYITINRASTDGNGWSRSNRWFHQDVLKATAEYNGTDVVIDNEFRAKRPIVEFEAGLRLFNFGVETIESVDIIDFNATDALSDVYGSTGYSTDGHLLAEGSRVIFANDTDANVRNTVYTVEFIDPDDELTDYDTIINLVPTDDVVVTDVVVKCLSGNQQGNIYTFNGTTWTLSQPKTKINQAPLFDVFDVNGYSLGDQAAYPSTTFTGTKIFSYKEANTSLTDSELGISLTYQNIGNIGDIVFENNFYTDTMLYVDGQESKTIDVSAGYLRQYAGLNNFTDLIGWTKSVDASRQRQVFTFKYASKDLVLDIIPDSDLTVPSVKVYVNNQFYQPENYTVTTTATQTYISITGDINVDDYVQVKVLSKTNSQYAYYEIPRNLERNPFNENSSTLTLGTIRNHYNSLVENVTDFVGVTNGANNTRDIGNLAAYGNFLIQNQAPMSVAGFVLGDPDSDFFASVDYSSKEYEKFKYHLMHWVNTNDVEGLTTAQILDAALLDINAGKSSADAFYASDMLPFGGDYVENTHLVTPITTGTFNTVNLYDFDSANTKGLSLYLNDELLVKDLDYTVATDGPRVTVTATLNNDDVLVIREYTTTYGNFVPETPTKLGMYPKFEPTIYVDDSYRDQKTVVRGHDGSITLAFGDTRDDVLLEFERRIYNNIKTTFNSTVDLAVEDVVPGKFRTTEYTLAETNAILQTEFLDWIGWHKITHKQQNFVKNDPWTYNYSSAVDKLDKELLAGHWRGIYNYYYDTDTPHLHPWHMVGFSVKPSWWEAEYGPAPYTSGNLVLWDDMAAGKIADPDNTRYDSRYARPNLLNVIPVDSAGNLKDPMQVMVGNYNRAEFEKSWSVGDNGPAEAAWKRSSAYPFAVQRLLALTKPAIYFATNVDKDEYRYNGSLDQYAFDSRYRLDIRTINLDTVANPKHSFFNWIANYATSQGINAKTQIENDIAKLNVQLCYRMAAYSDKKYLKLYIDKSSPTTTNTSLMIPDESFTLAVHKNQTFSSLPYSGVIVQKTTNGYAVYGNSLGRNYFRILRSSASKDFNTFEINGKKIRIPTLFTNNVVQIPYGYVFASIDGVVDFLCSYGAYLESQGMKFESTENNVTLNWAQMAREFIYWSYQGWQNGSLLNLNPAADSLEFERLFAVVEAVNGQSGYDAPLDQNRQLLEPSDYRVTRIDNNFKLTTKCGTLNNDRGIGYLNIKTTNYEHVIILDNNTIFNDLIYNPVTGVRQQRVRVSGHTTFEWDGQLNAQGFMLNQDNVKEWKDNAEYKKGDIVKYKNRYWTAASKIKPAETFNFEDWINIDYDNYAKGLLPNITSKAGEIENYYNNAVANLESDGDLFGLGLTGYRGREYLESLNLDDISQVGIYSNLISEKGTVNSANLYQGTTLNNETVEYNIFENWAVHRATYGGNDNKRYFEVSLDPKLLTGNPSIVEISNNSQNSVAQQHVPINSIYRQSIKNSTTNIMPELSESITDVSLPTAGFVNMDDVDIAIFSLDNLGDISDQLDKVVEGAYIWVAKSNAYDWNVYRCNVLFPNVISVIDNLNGTLNVEFDGTHGLTKGSIFVIKSFDDLIDGAYRVQSTVDNRTLTISGSLGEDVSTIDSEGYAFKLASARFEQAKDVLTSDYNEKLFANDKIWVDESIDGKWQVFERSDAFTASGTVTVPGRSDDTNFGCAAAQSLGNALLVGASAYSSGTGTVFTFSKDANSYVYRNLLASVNGLTGYGNSVALSNNWGVVGASGTLSNQGVAVVVTKDSTLNDFVESQVLTVPTGPTGTEAEFGYSVDISEDENWIYVGAPGTDNVYVYQRVEHQTQTVTFVGQGPNRNGRYDISDFISIEASNQITVTVDGVELTSALYSVEFDGNTTTLVLANLPLLDHKVVVTRNEERTFTGDGSTASFAITDDIVTIDNIDSFVVTVDDIIQRPYYDYTFDGNNVIFASAPAASTTVRVTAKTHYEYMYTINGNSGERFGHVVQTTTEGQQLVVGAPTASNTVGVEVLENSGRAYIYDRVVERVVVTDSAIKTYQVLRNNLTEDTYVYLNGELKVASTNRVDYDYTIDTLNGNITFVDGITLTVGDYVDIEIPEYKQVQTLTLADNIREAAFGSAISICRTDCSLYVGAPTDSWNIPRAGSVTRFLNRSRVYGTVTGSVSNPTVTVGDSIRINNVDVVFTGSSLTQVVKNINDAVIPNVRASANSNNQLVINVINTTEAPSLQKMTVMPGLGTTAFDDLGIVPFENVQVIRSPREEENTQFGSSVYVDYSASNLLVGSVTGNTRLPTTMADGTYWDARATEIVDIRQSSGAVYTFDLLPSSSYQIPGQFIFGQQIYDNSINDNDAFGTAISFVNDTLVVTSPDFDGLSTDTGRLAVFKNVTGGNAWSLLREQPTTVDARLINTIYTYNKITQKVLGYLDYIDPVNGKILGSVKQNIDIIGSDDPATYNVESSTGFVWAQNNVGKIWWDTTNCRYLDYNQDDVVYSSKNWGQLFPSSSIDVYEWVESSVPPGQYTGNGTVRNINEYSTTTGIDATRTVTTRYYFWVKDVTEVNTNAGKTLSALSLAQYIENPQSSGIPYAALMRKNIFALYNTSEIVHNDSAIHIEYSKTFADSNIFKEYDLIRDGNPGDFIPDNLYRKLQDSLCGVDPLGNTVPDVKLRDIDKYGVDFRPRQSMFIDRFAALRTYITHVNSVLLTAPFAELKTFNLLNAQEQAPAATENVWDRQLADYVELSYQDYAAVGVGYRYLVDSDVTNQGLWTIYEVVSGNQVELTRVQSYKTSNYWDYQDWYAEGYSSFTKPLRIVDTYSELLSTVGAPGDIVKVALNSAGKWELYVYDTQWVRVGVQDGTIQISSNLYDYVNGNFGFDSEVFDILFFDQNPAVETRKIVQAINEEILVGDYLIERNNLMILMFKFILAEQGQVEWLNKTSLIDVNHKIRDLNQYSVYRADNQDFLVEYINESKPYHVKIKEFLLRYEGLDLVEGNVYDFDVPAAYDADYEKFISPVLDDGVAVLTTDVSNRNSDDVVWQTHPWSVWYDNRLLTVDEVVVTNGGSGYTLPPVVIFSGNADTQATGVATINELGEVVKVTVTSTGSGYRNTPTIEFDGGNGSGAAAAVYTKHETVRSFTTTIKYDRYEYTSNVVDWEAETVYEQDQLVRHNNRVYRAVNADGSTESELTFDPELYELVDPASLSGLDRTRGLYVSDVNKPGLDLALLIDGLTYPGIQLTGVDFEDDTGFAKTNNGFDTVPYDNYEVAPGGYPRYSDTIIDNEILTSFTGSYVGVDLSGIEAVQATAIAEVNAGTLAVSNITMTEFGKGYSADAPPPVTISAPNANSTALAEAVISSDQVVGLNLIDGGFGYDGAATVTITAQEPTPGVQAVATATISGVSTGSVSDINISESGNGYIVTPTVTFSDPASVAVARATMTATITGGEVSSCTITNPGNSYTSAPTVDVTDPPASVTATATASCCTQALKIIDLTLTEGGNYYSVAPTVTIADPNETEVQAVATANISGGHITGYTIVDPGYLYESAPTVTITPAAPTTGTTATATCVLDTDYSGFDSDAGFDVAAFDAEGGVGTITIVTQGDGYTVAPIVTISAPDLTGGIQATATATISGDTAPLYAGDGYVPNGGIIVTEPGSGYTSPPTITIAAPDTVINHGTGATATAVLDGATSIASITVDTAGEFYDIPPTVTIGAPTAARVADFTATVSNGEVTGFTLVDRGWGYSAAPAVTIADPDVTPVTADITAIITGDEVTGYTIVDPGAGYLTAPALLLSADPSVVNDIATGTAVITNNRLTGITITNAGDNYLTPPTITIDPPTGDSYHGSGATADVTVVNNVVVGFNVTNPGTGYDLTPFVTISSPTRATRQATATANIVGGIVSSVSVDDGGLGYLRTPTVTIGTPTDIDPDYDIVGYGFVDEYSSHAPEELVPGAMFDTLDMRVYTRSGYDVLNDGHSFEVKSTIIDFVSSMTWASWDNLIAHPVKVIAYNASRGIRLIDGTDFEIDWADERIRVYNRAVAGEMIKVFAYSIGGGNQSYRNSWLGSEMTDGTEYTMLVDIDDIVSSVVFVNGQRLDTASYSFAAGDVASETVITLNSAINDDDFVSITVFGEQQLTDSTLTNPDLYSSYPYEENFTCDGSTNTFTTSADLIDGKQAENLVVEYNGLRLRGPGGIRHSGDNLTVEFMLPDRLGVDYTTLTLADIVVYINNVLIDSSEYSLTTPDAVSGSITMTSIVPADGETVDVYVYTGSEQASVGDDSSNDLLTVVTSPKVPLNAGDLVSVISWEDWRQLDPLTQVFVGPKYTVQAGRRAFDVDLYDEYSFDESFGIDVVANEFPLGRVIENTDRMWVTLDGKRLLPGEGYVLNEDNDTLIIPGGIIADNAVVVITTVTDNVVPNELGFRIFKDMRDNTAVYRLNESTTTFLTQTLTWTDDVIYVNDASVLGEPNLDAAIFGVLTVNGERITYRERDLENNTVSGLRRGTAGTGMHIQHEASSVVTDLSRGNAIPRVYEGSKRWKLADEYDAGSIVYHGVNYYIANVSVPANTDITNTTYWKLYDEIWYESGTGTASNGVPLQDQNTLVARFLQSR